MITDKNMMDIIRIEGKKHKISQEEMALKLGVSRTAINKWYKGEYFPTITNYVKMCEILGLTILVENTNR